MQFKFQSMLTLILWICQWLHEASEIYNDMWIYMMWMYIYMIIYMHMLSHVGLFTSHAVTSFQWMNFVLRCVLHVRGGWVGTCSFPMQWRIFDPAQLILRFPPQMGKSNSYADWKTWKDNAMRAIPNVICNDPSDAMLHHHLRSNSPLTAVAENRCWATIVSSSWHVSLMFLKSQPNKLFDMTTTMFLWYPMNILYDI